MTPLKNLKGKRFGKFLVLGRHSENANGGRAKWLCLCSCGRQVAVVSSNLINGNSTSCGHKVPGPANPRWKGHGEISSVYWHDIKAGARRRGFELAVTIEAAWDLFLLQERRCALSGRALTMKTSRAIGGDASLDRINSAAGYIPGNIQWTHKDINRIKMHLPQEEFLRICRDVANHTNGSA